MYINLFRQPHLSHIQTSQFFHLPSLLRRMRAQLPPMLNSPTTASILRRKSFEPTQFPKLVCLLGVLGIPLVWPSNWNQIGSNWNIYPCTTLAMLLVNSCSVGDLGAVLATFSTQSVEGWLAGFIEEKQTASASFPLQIYHPKIFSTEAFLQVMLLLLSHQWHRCWLEIAALMSREAHVQTLRAWRCFFLTGATLRQTWLKSMASHLW